MWVPQDQSCFPSLSCDAKLMMWSLWRPSRQLEPAPPPRQQLSPPHNALDPSQDCWDMNSNRSCEELRTEMLEFCSSSRMTGSGFAVDTASFQPLRGKVNEDRVVSQKWDVCGFSWLFLAVFDGEHKNIGRFLLLKPSRTRRASYFKSCRRPVASPHSFIAWRNAGERAPRAY